MKGGQQEIKLDYVYITNERRSLLRKLFLNKYVLHKTKYRSNVRLPVFSINGYKVFFHLDSVPLLANSKKKLSYFFSFASASICFSRSVFLKFLEWLFTFFKHLNLVLLNFYQILVKGFLLSFMVCLGLLPNSSFRSS